MLKFRESVKSFLRNEDGTVVIESVMVLPMLMWCVIMLYSFWDVFQVSNVVQKAAHTVSDVVSRAKKDTFLTATDISGFHDLMNYLIELDVEDEADIRITKLHYDLDDDKYMVNWSCGRGMAPLSDGDLAAMRPRLVKMEPNAPYILFEAQVKYDAVFNLDLLNQNLREFHLIFPRVYPADLESCL